MKKLILILLSLAFFSFDANSNQDSRVWICTGSSAVAYHCKRTCPGLNNCKAKIIQVTEQEDIQTWGRRKCKRCY